MPKRITPLSDSQVKSAKPQAQDYKLMDGYGLFLLVIAWEWYNRQVPVWSTTHAATVISRLKRDVFPHVGARPIAI